MYKQIKYNSRYKRIRKQKAQKRLIMLIFFSLIIFGILQFNQSEPQKPVIQVKQQATMRLNAPKDVKVSNTPTPTQPPLKSHRSESNAISTQGYVSHYSRAGCLGCSENFTMANGQPLDDTAMTIAVHPHTLAMGTKVKLTNTDNGKEAIATVTDTGGFKKYNRVADLTIAVGNALETKTDVSIVKIEVLPY